MEISEYSFTNSIITKLWPIAKTGFSAPVLDVNYPGCQITCFVEYSATLLYACTSQGNIIEVNSRNYRSELISTIENEVPMKTLFCYFRSQSSVSSMKMALFSSPPLPGASTACFLSSNAFQSLSFFIHLVHTRLFLRVPFSSLSFSLHFLSAQLRGLLFRNFPSSLQPQNKPVRPALSLNPRIIGILQTPSAIVAADILNDRVVAATADQRLFLWNALSLSSPVASVLATQPIAALRFNRLLRSASRTSSTFTTPQKQSSSMGDVGGTVAPSSITSTPSKMLVEETERREEKINSAIQSRGETMLEGVESGKLRETLREVVQPMMMELQTYVHREVSDLKADMIRQFSDQEQIIQQQRDQIELLLSQFQQRG